MVSDKKKYLLHLRRFRSILLWKAIRICSLGITTTEDYTVRNNIRLMNLILAITIFSVVGMGIFFMIFLSFWQAAACFITAAFLCYPFYLNAKGKNLKAKLCTTAAVNSSLMLWCCLFTHKTILSDYFLFMATVCIYLYTRKERKWVFITVSFSLLCFIIESSQLVNYLPNLNFIASPQELQKTNNILLGGLIVMLVGEVSSYVYLSEIKEKKLSNTKTMLLSSRKKLRQQNDDLKIFGAAASHSLQTPIYISKFFVDKINKEIRDTKLTETTSNYFEVINSSLLQMESFITGLFSYYKIIDIEKKSENIEVVKELLQLKNMLLQKYLKAHIIIPEKKIVIATNRVLFILILQNLIENALEYNQAEYPFVKIGFVKSSQSFSILVEDNGIGIDKAYWKKIFDPFVRITNGQIITGAGLGLAGAKRAAEVIGARLYCENSNSNGSIFKIDF